MLRNIETEEYRYFYAHEKNTLFEKCLLLCTKADLTTIQNKVNKIDIIENCTLHRQNTKWLFKLITNVTIFAALLKNVPMGCPDSVIPEPLLRNNRIKIQNNLTMTSCVYFERLQFPYMEQLISKHPPPRSLMILWKN